MIQDTKITKLPQVQRIYLLSTAYFSSNNTIILAKERDGHTLTNIDCKVNSNYVYTLCSLLFLFIINNQRSCQFMDEPAYYRLTPGK